MSIFLAARAIPILLLALALAAPCSAQTRRLAMVVGNNAGTGERPPLQFAEADAGKLARLLVELGGVSPDDLMLLQGQPAAALDEAFSRAREKIADWHRDVRTRAVLLFFFSGHSDGEALELGHERVSFDRLLRSLEGTGADVRLIIVDSCKSGQLLATKGGRPGVGFDLHLVDDLTAKGHAILASSAADELALESAEIAGSYFTHHLVSGLRGAADSSGDGRVTLGEAYQYAFAHTVSATAKTVLGPQHPAYDFRLSGQGEFVLSDLSRPAAVLELPEAFERALVTQPARGWVVAEVTTGGPRRVAVGPGEYVVQAWREKRAYAARFRVTNGDTRRIRWEELPPLVLTPGRDKGGRRLDADPLPDSAAGSRTLAWGLGFQRGIARDVGALTASRLALVPTRPTGWSGAVQLATGRAAGFRESLAGVLGGYRLSLVTGGLTLFTALELGGGIAVQSPDTAATLASGMAVAAPSAGASFALGRALSLALEGQLPAALLRRDGKTVVTFLPALWLGLSVGL